MLADPQSLYDLLASGGTSDSNPRKAGMVLLRRALAAIKEPDIEVRLGAIRVVTHLSREAQIAVARQLTRDPEDWIRRWALDLALAAGGQALDILNELAHDAAPTIAIQALDRLIAIQQSSALHTGRALLGHANPAIRSRAATLVGLLGGKGMVVSIRNAAAGETRALVTASLLEAEAWLMGDEPRPPKSPIPQDTGTCPVVPEPQDGATALPALDLPALPQRALSESTGLKAVTEAEDDADDPGTALVPTPEDPETEEAEWDPDGMVLPAVLPTDAAALLKLLGLCAEADQAEVYAALEAADGTDGALTAGFSHREASRRRGALLAAGLGPYPVFAARARPRVRDDDPRVRAAAFFALGELGGAGVFPQLRDGQRDPDPAARIACIRAFLRWGERTGRDGMALDAIRFFADDPDAAVKQAATDALEG